jgi:hypothetical protein
MRFKKVIMVLVLGLIFATSAWAQPSNWAVFVPTHAQSNGSGGADFYSYYVNNHFFCSLWDKSGIDHFNWTCCCAGNPGYLDPVDPPYAYFDSYTLAGDYYDCDGQLLQSDAARGAPFWVRPFGSLLRLSHSFHKLLHIDDPDSMELF